MSKTWNGPTENIGLGLSKSEEALYYQGYIAAMNSPAVKGLYEAAMGNSHYGYCGESCDQYRDAKKLITAYEAGLKEEKP